MILLVLLIALQKTYAMLAISTRLQAESNACDVSYYNKSFAIFQYRQ
jgi:hypothetical protein